MAVSTETSVKIRRLDLRIAALQAHREALLTQREARRKARRKPTAEEIQARRAKNKE